MPRAVLFDIEGVLCTGDTPLPGALEAVQRVRRAALGLRFVTNTTRRTRAGIVTQLARMGFDATPDEVVTGALAARRRAEARGLRPMLLVHPNLLPDFDGLDMSGPDALILGDAGDGFSYRAMNDAFRVLLAAPPGDGRFIALAANRYFRAADGLWLDAGPFMVALEHATGRRAEVTGKPSRAIFETALAALDVAAHEAVMIGDDLESDVAGAQAAGLCGVLVRSGKFRPTDEAHPHWKADAVVDGVRQAVDLVLGGG